jgi:formylglycine-generating enzyme required for sulfatase activity
MRSLLLFVSLMIATAGPLRNTTSLRIATSAIGPSAQPQITDGAVRERARAAVDQLSRGEAEAVWPLLRHSSDPTLRSYLISTLAQLPDVEIIARRLRREPDVSIRRALILSLGGFPREQIKESVKKRLVVTLLRWYRDDPDAGIHGAIDWLFRYTRQGNASRKFDWGQTAALRRIDAELSGKKPGSRNWYVTREKQTMVIVTGPVRFAMGSPESERARTSDELLHQVRIPRSFAVGAKEVTVAEFQRFLENNRTLTRHYPDVNKDPQRGSRAMQTFSPEDDCPQIVVTWYEAAQYCNWLSEREGIPRSEWCYPTLNEIKTGMKLPPDYLQRRGYRMLTEAEWEFTARGGSITSRFFGSTDELLSEYAWFSRNPPKRKSDPIDPNDPQRTWPVGQLKPNDYGIFDIYGNVWEWLHDRRREYAGRGVTEDTEDTVLTVDDRQFRIRRGGSFAYEAAVMRSAHRGRSDGYYPMERRDNVGFRIGRTYLR